MAGPQSPIVIHDHTQAGIRWIITIHPEFQREGFTIVRFLKRGKYRNLVDQLSSWGPGRWQSGPGRRVPRSLQERVVAHLQQLRKPAAPKVILRSRVEGASEGISCGGMSFPAFLAMELAEAHLQMAYGRLPLTGAC